MWKYNRVPVVPECPNCGSKDFNGLPHLIDEYDAYSQSIITMKFLCNDCDQVYYVRYQTVDIYTNDEEDELVDGLPF